MISSFHIRNFKCLLDVQVDLGPFTVLIGTNDSGKTSMLEALHLLGKTIQEPWPNVFTDERTLINYLWRKDSHRSLQWEVTGEINETPFTYRLSLSPEFQWPNAEELRIGKKNVLNLEKANVKQVYFNYPYADTTQKRDAQATTVLQVALQANRTLTNFETPAMLVKIAEVISSSAIYSFYPAKMHAKTRFASKPILESSGENLAGVLDAILTGPDRQAVLEIEQALHSAIPTLRGFSLRAVDDNKKSLEYVLAGQDRPLITIPAALASSGALLLTAYLALSYGDTQPLLLIEEPENGLHPSRLKLVVDVLRKMSSSEAGNRRRQVILTTHSPILLNFVRPEEVRILTRDPERGTLVTPMDKVSNIHNLLKEFAPGELWYLMGEEALLKEQPA